jgi:hypothetical protein
MWRQPVAGEEVEAFGARLVDAAERAEREHSFGGAVLREHSAREASRVFVE